jgi:hypothetical protein
LDLEPCGRPRLPPVTLESSSISSMAGLGNNPVHGPRLVVCRPSITSD